MTDTSVADQGDAPPPTWTPPQPNLPSPLRQLAGVWQRGVPKTPDQPTTVANLGGPAPVMQEPPYQQVRPQPQPWSQHPQPPRVSPPGTPELSPTGQPPPMRRFSPYIPAQPIRPPEQWGMPWPYRPEPAPFEVPGIYHGVGNWFGQNGSGITALLGLGMGKYAGDFIKGYLGGQEFQSKHQIEQAKFRAFELAEKQKEESDDAADVFNAYSAVDYKPLNGKTAEDALAEVGYKYNDDTLLSVLGTGGIKAAYDLIRARDSKWQDLTAANKAASTKQEDDTTEEGKDWGETPPASGQQQQTVPGAPNPPPGWTPHAQASGAPAPPAAAPPEPTAPDPDSADIASSDASEVAQIVKTGDEDAAYAKGAQMGEATDNVEELARIEWRGGEPNPSTPKWVEQRAASKAANLARQADKLVDSNLQGQDLLNAMRRLDGPTARLLEDVVAGKRFIPTSGGMSGHAAEFWDKITTFASRIDPTWNPQLAHQKQIMMDAYSRGPQANAMQSSARLAQAAGNVANAINDVEKQYGPAAQIPLSNYMDWALGKVSGDPRFTNLYAAWRSYVAMYVRVARGGQGAVFDEKTMLAGTPLWGSPEQLRGTLKIDTSDALGSIDILNDEYVKNFSQPAPYYNKDAVNALRMIRNNLNPKTGHFVDLKTKKPLSELPRYLQPAPDVTEPVDEAPTPGGGPPPSAPGGGNAPSPGWGPLQ